MTQKNQSGRFLPTLDGWRGVAILMVLCCHGVAPLTHHPKLHALFSTGGFGVHVFFVLSGFLITIRSLQEIKTKGFLNLKSFYIKRVFRILPTATTYILFVGMLSQILDFPIDTQSYLGSLFFYKNFVPDETWYLSHFWSLSVEEQFYLFWPFLLWACAVPWSMRLGLVIYSLLLIPSFLNFGFQDQLLHHTYILSGSFMAFLYMSPGFSRFKSLITTQSFHFTFLVLFGLGLINKLPLRDFLFPWVIASLIFGSMISSKSFLHRALEMKWLKVVGLYSYSIYVWQQLFLLTEAKYLVWSPIQSFPINFLLVGLTSYLSFRFIETPAINLGRIFLKRKTGSEKSVKPQKKSA